MFHAAWVPRDLANLFTHSLPSLKCQMAQVWHSSQYYLVGWIEILEEMKITGLELSNGLEILNIDRSILVFQSCPCPWLLWAQVGLGVFRGWAGNVQDRAATVGPGLGGAGPASNMRPEPTHLASWACPV